MGKLWRSTIVTNREKNLGKFPFPSKCLSLFHENLKPTLNALTTEIKEALASEVKQSTDEQFSQLKE